jgi:hypothetical protein
MPEVCLVHFQVTGQDFPVIYALDQNGTMWYTFNFRDQDAWVKVKSPKIRTEETAEQENDLPETSDLTPVNSA